MKKILNKKGFTLVELLAVIVILAVIILVAMNAVIPQMKEARKSAFATEIQTFSKAAETYFTKEAMTDASVLSGNSCVSVGYLKGTYIKKSDTNYQGVACINNNNIYLTLTSGEFKYNGQVTGRTEQQIETTIDTTTSGNSPITNGTLPSCPEGSCTTSVNFTGTNIVTNAANSNANGTNGNGNDANS